MRKEEFTNCSPGKPRKLFACIFGAFILLHCIMIWSPRIYPFTDVPNHLGLATILRHYDEPGNHFNQFYTIDPALKPNTFHMYFTSLKLFPSVEFGNKVFYCLYAILLPLSVLITIKKTGGNPWFALLSFFFLYNYNVSYGFVGFTIALPFILFLFALIPGYLQNNKMWPAAAIAALFILLFFMHALAALFALFVFFACAAYHNRNSFTGAAKKTIVALPVLTLIFLWWRADTSQFEGPALINFIVNYYLHDYPKSINLRAGFFMLDNYALYEGLRGYLTAAFFSLFVVLIVLVGFFSKKKKSVPMSAVHTASCTSIFLLCSLACLVFMPLSLPGYGFLVQRFPVLVFLALILFGSRFFIGGMNNLLKIGICLTVLLHGICWHNYINAFNRENALFSGDFFELCSNDVILTGLIYDNQFRGRPIYKQFQDYYIVWKKGIASTRLVDERSFALRRKTGGKSIPPYIDHKDYMDIKELGGVDYILTRGSIPAGTQKALQPFTRVKTAGQWSLSECTRRMSAPDSPGTRPIHAANNPG